ncbi:immunity protein YezG family protein [Priestia megaterium]|uniref:immunity protein YezG family protein n=1 Tax=Priestia megaterium TaxID=1404 RepID=UPI0003458BF7|nr:immunity protein YezG family protein [Priestia megaterium]AYE50887.1 DUF600 family protein [Priestia megaterium NCT-2]UMZ30797.1 DUF600 family protein [Priestia megaterium]
MKEFKAKFSELQADMISICMEYVEDSADKVYVYASCEENMISSSFFYLINDKYVERHRVNDAWENRKYDVSTKRQSMVLNIINDDVEKIEELCRVCERDMPTEMKLIYHARSGRFKAEYKYDLVHTNDDIKTASDIADEWFEEVKNNKL